MQGREEILDRPSRLDNLDALSRANEVAVAQARNPDAVNLAHNSALEVVLAQRVVVQRDLPSFIQRIKMLAAVAGESYYYSFPVRKKNKETGKWENADPIEGPSIQLAQDLAREYGNCAVDTKVFDIGDRWVIYARFTDYERGFTQVRPYLQRKGQGSIGGNDRGRQEDAAFQIGVSKAIRNVIVKSLETFSDMMFEQARSGLVAAVAKKLPDYKAKIARRLSELKVPLSRVEPYVGRPIADWDAHETTRVVVELKSISEGMATADEVWPAPETYIDPNASNKGDRDGKENAEATNRAGDPSVEGKSESRVEGAEQSKGDGVPSSGRASDSPPGEAGDAGRGTAVSTSGQPANGKPEPKPADTAAAEEQISQGLAVALSELLKMQDAEAVAVLDEQAQAALAESDYEKFMGARDERLKVLAEKEATAAAAKDKKANKKS